MNIDRVVLAFAGLMVLVERGAGLVRLAGLDAARRLRGPEPVPVGVHRLLPAGADPAAACGIAPGCAFR